MESNKNIGDDFLKILLSADISNKSLARKSGVSEAAIRSWTTNERTPRITTAEWVLSVLGYRIRIEKCNGETEDSANE